MMNSLPLSICACLPSWSVKSVSHHHHLALFFEKSEKGARAKILEPHSAARALYLVGLQDCWTVSRRSNTVVRYFKSRVQKSTVDLFEEHTAQSPVVEDLLAESGSLLLFGTSNG